mgnify:CR=1 FL=1
MRLIKQNRQFLAAIFSYLKKKDPDMTSPKQNRPQITISGKVHPVVKLFKFVMLIACVSAVHLLFWGTEVGVLSAIVSLVAGWFLSGITAALLAVCAAIFLPLRVWYKSGQGPK